MSFNAGELGIAYKENSSDDQRERVAEFGQAGTFIGLTTHDPWQRTYPISEIDCRPVQFVLIERCACCDGASGTASEMVSCPSR